MKVCMFEFFVIYLPGEGGGKFGAGGNFFFLLDLHWRLVSGSSTTYLPNNPRINST